MLTIVTFSSVGFLVFHYENPNPHKKANHQQHGCDTCDNDCIHIHSVNSCSI